MKQPKKPARWQLDVFMLVMIGLLLMIMGAQLSPGWERVVDSAWSFVTLGGMGIWAWVNNDALNDEERERRLQRVRGASSPSVMAAPRDTALTPVQRHFLAVTQAQHRAEQVGQAHDETRHSRPLL
jgi:hypothetical protein